MAPRNTRNDEAQRKAVIQAVLARAASEAFSEGLLKRAAEDAGVKDVEHLFPGGMAGLIADYSAEVDAEMERHLSELKLSSMSVRRRIKSAVKARLAILKPHKDAVRRAVAWLALPPNVPLGARLVYRTVDCIWRAVGDRSTDFTYYTKRGTLVAVYSATLMRWLADTSAHESDTNAFLDARLENVMQYEKLKGRVREGARIGLERMSELLHTVPRR